MFSVSALPQPPAWVCCLIYPSWSWALLHTSKSTLAQSTCYYLLAGLPVCQKNTQTKGSSGAMTKEGNKGNTLLFLPFDRGQTSPGEASDLNGKSNPWRGPSTEDGHPGVPSLSESCWVPEMTPLCLHSGHGRVSLGSVATFRPWIQESLNGWAEHAPSLLSSLPHSQPRFFSLLRPLLSHRCLDRSAPS